jgi:predicted nucleic acid-binding protein
LPEVICNTSPLQYLYQLDLLSILPALAGTVWVPPAVVDELAVGRAAGVRVPDPETLPWVKVRRPVGEVALPLVNDLGPGETEVLMLALELRGAVVVLDDGLARQVAETLRLPLTGTLGLLLDGQTQRPRASRGASVGSTPRVAFSGLGLHARDYRPVGGRVALARHWVQF